MTKESKLINVSKEIDKYLFADEDSAFKKISEPVLNYGDFNAFVETVKVQPGMVMHIVKIPEDVEFEIVMESKNAPLSFECWLNGNATYKYEDKKGIRGEEAISEGHIIMGSPGRESGVVRKIAGEPMEFIKLDLDQSLLKLIIQNTLKDEKVNYSQFLPVKNNHKFTSIKLPYAVKAAAQGIADCFNKPPFRKLILANKANELFYTIIMEVLVDKSVSRQSALQPEDISKFYTVKEMIEANLQKPLSHSQIARKVSINEFKLKSGFKEMFGTTIYNYLLEKRMSKAKIMLESGDFTVSEAAWDIGYTNVSHFIATFKKYYGTTPGKLLISIKERIREQNAKSSV